MCYSLVRNSGIKAFFSFWLDELDYVVVVVEEYIFLSEQIRVLI